MSEPDLLPLLLFSPLFAAVFCLPVFGVVTVIRKLTWRTSFHQLLVVLQWPVIISVGGTFGFVMIWSVIYNAEQGPLVFIFLGPAAFTLGVVAGTLIWIFFPMKPNPTVERDARKSGARRSP